MAELTARRTTRRRLGSRGQVMPFWALVSSALLALTFLVANYGYLITWQLRAQTAADSVATATLSADANVENEVSILLYLAALDEYRIRAYTSMLVSMNAEVNGTSTVWPNANNPCNITNNCWNFDNQITADLVLATSRLYSVASQLRQMQVTISPGGYQETSGLLGACSMSQQWINASTAPQPALVTSSNPIDLTNFTYVVTPTSRCPSNPAEPAQAPTVGQSDPQATAETIDVIACSNTITPLLSFPLFKGFVTAGRSTATLVQNTEYIEPGTLGACNMVPSDCSSGLGVFFPDGTALQPVEFPGEYAAWYPTPGNGTVQTPGGYDPFVVDFSNFSATISWYSVGWIQPAGKAAAACPAPKS